MPRPHRASPRAPASSISASQPRSSSINSSRNRRSSPVNGSSSNKQASSARADCCGRRSCDHNPLPLAAARARGRLLRQRAQTETSHRLFDDLAVACSIGPRTMRRNAMFSPTVMCGNSRAPWPATRTAALMRAARRYSVAVSVITDSRSDQTAKRFVLHPAAQILRSPAAPSSSHCPRAQRAPSTAASARTPHPAPALRRDVGSRTLRCGRDSQTSSPRLSLPRRE